MGCEAGSPQSLLNSWMKEAKAIHVLEMTLSMKPLQILYEECEFLLYLLVIQFTCILDLSDRISLNGIMYQL